MIYTRHPKRCDDRYRQMNADTLKIYAKSCTDLDTHGEDRNFKSLGMMSRSMPRFFYDSNRTADHHPSD